jgi:hypothetical protein
VFSDRRLECADVPVRVDGRGAEVEGEGEAAVVRGEEATLPALKGGFLRFRQTRLVLTVVLPSSLVMVVCHWRRR